MLSRKQKLLIALGSLAVAIAILSGVEAVMLYYQWDSCWTPGNICLVD